LRFVFFQPFVGGIHKISKVLLMIGFEREAGGRAL
jgi:hypothetical protein